MKKKRIRVVIAILIGIFTVLFLYQNGEARHQSPFMTNYMFEAISQVTTGSNGYTYAIDNGKKNVLVLNEEKELIRKIVGGSENTPFFYAEKVCGDIEGNIYVADTISGDQGNRIQKERIIKIRGNRSSIVYEFDYSESERVPLQYGDILKLQEYGKDIYFIKEENAQVDVYKIASETEEVEKIAEFACPYYISDATYDVSTQTILITTRLGEIYSCKNGQSTWDCIPMYESGQMPWSISATNGEAYYTDLKTCGVYHFKTQNLERPTLIYRNENVLYGLGISGDGKILNVTDNEIFIEIDNSDYSVHVYKTCDVANRLRVVLFWGGTAAFILVELIIFASLFAGVFRTLPNKAGTGRIALVVGSSIIVSIIASYSTVSVLMNRQDELMERNMQLFAESLRAHIDVDILKTLNEPSDYRTEEYLHLKEKLDKQIEAGYENGIYYYYILCNTDGTNINCVMDYEDSMGCGHPLYLYGENEYTQVFTTGEMYTVSELSSYGAWMFILLPIFDEAGNVIAELEVGSNLDTLMQEKSELVKENIVTVLCSCGVMIMLILECVFAISFFENRRDIHRDELDITQQMPIRIMVFLVYLTDSMQDAFIAILCSRLYADTLPIPREMAIALPMSLQLMMAAIFSLVGGSFVGKLGIRRNMQLGFISQMIGFAICMMIPNYAGVLCGKVFIGMGLGIVYVTCNTMASMGKNSDFVENAFADVSAGVLSGVTIGAGVGSIVLSFANYRMVYLVGVILLTGGFLLTFFAQNIQFEERKVEKVNVVDMLKFIFSRRVSRFFLFILVPFMMSLSYREYFFPLYVEPFGIDEVQIGRIYLGCGVLVLYIGPYLSKHILRILGAQKSIVFASLCMTFNMALFVLMPNLYSVMIGMVIFAIVISFAYTCQYTYFEGLDECNDVGMGNAMGIYSMFENVGQTLGPIIYGAVLMLGNRKGIFVLFMMMLLISCIYLKLEIRRMKEHG